MNNYIFQPYTLLKNKLRGEKVKKYVLSILLLCSVLLVGCGKETKESVVKDLSKAIEKTDGYYLEGEMEIINNEDVYTYNVEVSYKKDDQYRVSLTNKANNHEQIILKNNDGVYVITHQSTQL